MRCPACGFDNPLGIRFCGGCARALAPVGTCASCGFANPPGFRFCGECARPLAAASDPKRDPLGYTPKHLVDRILQSRSALEGERKQVTVLFADVKSSMQLAESVDAEEWHGILDGFFQILADGVHRFEGTVNQYTGDGIMALFGAPIAHEDHVQRACFAALWLRDQVREYARELKRERGLEFAVRLGLSSGEVVVGKIGDDLRMDYTAQGRVVGLAARMQELADPGAICLAPATAQLVAGFFELADLGEFRIRGGAEPLRVHELRGVGALRTRFDASRARGLTRFVGRGVEMATLEAALGEARAANGQVVCVVAEPGTGKSRLCFELVELCRARGLRVLEASAVSHGQKLPLLPIFALFRAWFGIDERDDARSAREKIAGRLLLLDDGLRAALPVVFEFLGVGDPERPTPELEPSEREQQLFGVLHRLVRSAGPDPVVVLVEDLHWIDAASERFLEQWVAAIARARGLLLLNFRPEFRADWLERAHVQRVALQPLAADAQGELVRELLGEDESVAELAKLVHERAAGNPFFAEELVQSLVEQGNLAGARGAYRLATPASERLVPASVQAVLAARIDRLADREKQLLQTAAVIGREFAQRQLEEVADSPRGEIEPALAELAARELVYPRTLYPEAEWAFKHPLTQEVALGSQLRERRRLVHARVAHALERSVPDAPHELAPLVAHHFEEAGEALAASRWHWRAAEWQSATDLAVSLRHWSRVRELLGPAPETAEGVDLATLACTRLLFFGAAQYRPWQEVEALYAEGLALTERSRDPRARASLELEYTQTLLIVRLDRGAGLARAQRMLELCEASGDAVLIGQARAQLAGYSWASGEFEAALALTDEVLAAAERARARSSDVSLRRDAPLRASGIRAFSLLYLGRLRECSEEIERTRALAAEKGDRFGRVQAEHIAALVLGFRGELSGLSDHVQRANAAVADVRTAATTHAYALATSGEALLFNGAWSEAARLLQSAVDLQPATNARLRFTVDLALAQLGLGNVALARELAEAALDETRERGLRGVELWALLALVRVRRAQDGARASREVGELLRCAAALLDETHARVYEPILLEERAALARLVGDGDAATRALRDAHAAYAAMGATGHAARLLRELPTA